MRRFFGVLLLVLAGSAVAVAYLHASYERFLDRPLALGEEGDTYDLPPGGSIRALAAEWTARGWVAPWPDPWYLEAYARWTGQAPRLKAGEYAVDPGVTPRELIARIVAGRVIQHSLTVVEGWTFRQLRAAVHAHPRLRQTVADLDDSQIMERLGYPDLHPEGWFFPDTYLFPSGTTDLQFLRRAHETMRTRLEQAWAVRSDGLPLASPEQALILASIIEKETGLREERREVAGVFVRRLERGMLLQTDPTVIYGLGENFEGPLTRAHLRSDTPYNTYTRGGLPPTPIALPGAGSLAAAVDPADGDALYFVARGDGTGGHVFSRTLDEHNRAVRDYRRNLQQRAQ